MFNVTSDYGGSVNSGGGLFDPGQDLSALGAGSVPKPMDLLGARWHGDRVMGRVLRSAAKQVWPQTRAGSASSAGRAVERVTG